MPSGLSRSVTTCIESKQLEPLLVAYRNAPADVRSVAHAAVKGRLAAGLISTLLVPNQEALTVVNAVHGIDSILAEASPSERNEMATALEALLFAGEQPRFRTLHAHERRLWSAIERAKAGEAPHTSEDAKGN